MSDFLEWKLLWLEVLNVFRLMILRRSISLWVWLCFTVLTMSMGGVIKMIRSERRVDTRWWNVRLCGDIDIVEMLPLIRSV